MKKIFLIILLLSFSLSAQEKNYLATRSFNRASLGSTLYKNLIAFWKFDGNWNDSIGHNDLKPSGGPYVSATGKSGQAASFEKDSTQYASITDNADLSFANTESFTIAGWIKLETINNFSVIASKGKLNGSGIAEREYAVGISSTTNKPRIVIFSGINSDNFITTSDTVVTTGKWYFICAWHNATTDSIYIRVNNGAIARVKKTVAVFDGTNQFNIGYYYGTGDANTSYTDAIIDDVAIYSRVPVYTNNYSFTDSLYNAGSGWRP